MKAAVITISDRASRGEYEDLSGPAITEILRQKFQEEIELSGTIVADEMEAILHALNQYESFDLIITTGGTGLGPRDITPEVSAAWCDRDVPGISEAIRIHSYRETPMAVLSRGYSGLHGNTLIINLPGSVKAVTSCTNYLLGILEHALLMIKGEGH